jgi:hypothetical protein
LIASAIEPTSPPSHNFHFRKSGMFCERVLLSVRPIIKVMSESLVHSANRSAVELDIGVIIVVTVPVWISGCTPHDRS